MVYVITLYTLCQVLKGIKMVPKTTNWQLRLEPRLASMVRKKAKEENRSLNKTVILILELYFGLKEEHAKTIMVINDIDQT